MIKIAIVDDEERIRLGLGKLISQLGDRFEVVESYSSAYEMLANARELRADLVLTDIKMPNMNGLELIEKAKEVRPDLRFAILSGFDDFSYARQAIRCGAIEYLLKPVDKGDLLKLLERVGDESARKRDSEQSRVDDLFRLLLLNEMSGLPAHLVDDAAKELETLPLMRENFAVFVAKGAPSLSLDRWSDAAAFSRRERFVLLKDERTIAAVFAIGGRDHASTTKELGQTLLMKLPPGFRGRLGCSNVFGGPKFLRQAYTQAEQAIEHAWYSEGRTAFQSYDAIAKKAESSTSLRLLDKAFGDAIELAQYDKAEETLRKWSENTAELRLSWSELLDSSAALQRWVGSVNASADGGESSCVRMRSPGEFADWQEFRTDFLRTMTDKLGDLKRARQESRVVEKVKAFIQRHYTEEMELSRLAEEVFLTPSYLSKLFKTETGETLTEYHISVRIDRAKDLLKEELALKTYEVGERVGYYDPAYFNKIFKKTVGCTPKEYRDRVR